MDKYTRHVKTWRLLYRLLHGFIEHKFNLSHEDICPEGPCIVIPNHVSEWDPLLVAMSFPEKQMYFVASEHLFRKGPVSRLLCWLVAPIARKKASMGTDTVKACLRELRAGHSVCLFAEGEACWAGVSGKVFPATGKLVRASGASLVTYRLQGGYLSDPRWGRGIRRGRTHGAPVRVYSPEELRAMSPEEITAAIDRDIYEDAWQRQREEKIEFRGKNTAEFMESALFLCPKCGRTGSLKGRGRRLQCACGLDLEFTAEGFFRPARPFETLADWNRWQHEALRRGDFVHGEELFSDGEAALSKIRPEHREELICRGRLIQYDDRLVCGGERFPLSDIAGMALVQSTVLLVQKRDGEYYQLRVKRGVCLRKYLAYWEKGD